jgi:hypothetical protein
MKKHRVQSGKQYLKHLFLFLACAGLTACVGGSIQPKSNDVSVAAIGNGSGEATQTSIKREQLAVELMRYADRYAGRMSLEADIIKKQAPSNDLRWFATGWNLMSQKTVLDISIGPNAVENLLDMLVFATLTRLEVENYWVPDYLGAELGDGLLQSSRILEKDIWDLSGTVLTPEQQQDLRNLIQEWRDANPNQHFFWSVRFSGFSSQRAKDLEQVRESGGLLAEVQMTRETAEEIQAFSERLLHYLQRAPGITRLEAEFAMREALRTPEINQLMVDAHRMSISSARYAAVAEKLSSDSTQLMDKMFKQIAQERETAINQLADRQLVVLRELLTSRELGNAVDTIGREGSEIANTTFIRGVLLILIWVIAYVIGKLGYDYIKHRMTRPPQA